jgi:hypothetical protein
VHMEARMLCEPRLNVGMLAGGVVVADEMGGLCPLGFLVDLAQELQPLGVAALGTARDPRTIQGAHRREQGGRAMSLVVMG